MTMENYFSIRYVKLHFEIEFIEDTVMPIYKTSAFRGGMGEMLLRMNCIKNRNCEACDFESECLVRRIMYSKMEIQPAFMTKGDSVGYVLDCENYQENFSRGDRLRFDLTLFGKTIVYFAQILDAFFRLGMYGVGKNHSQYQIVEVTNSKGKEILRGNDILMGRYQAQTVAEYVRYRKRQFTGDESQDDKVRMRFKTPLALKYQGNMLKEFNAEAIIAAIKRRIYILNCFEGTEVDWDADSPGVIPTITKQKHRQAGIPRYSNRRNEKMLLRGIEGECFLESVQDEMLSLLLAGELVHIGKNTSFGFGRYRVHQMTD